MGPPNQHVDEKNAVAGWGRGGGPAWDGEGDQACVAVDLAPLAGQTPAGPGSDIAGKTAPHKPR
jgi:hypothetical protein